VAVTAGLRPLPDGSGGWLVPRQELVGTLQVLLQCQRLKVAPALPEAALLVRELANFRAKSAIAAEDLVLSWREGEHDDLVLAVALACWHAGREQDRKPPETIVTPRLSLWPRLGQGRSRAGRRGLFGKSG
jgi:hypothetical protein